MATKATGISRDLIVHPGEIIADILIDRGITQSELAKRTGVSEAFVSFVLSGKKGISVHFAAALEYALSVPKSFWLNLQANYDAEILAAEEANSISDDERVVCAELKEIIKYLRKIGRIPVAQKEDDVILSMRKTLQVSNLCNLSNLTSAGVFRMSESESYNPSVLGAWLQLCQTSAVGKLPNTFFYPHDISDLVKELKLIMLDIGSDIQTALPEVFAKYGISFSIVKNFKGAPVQGYICSKKEGTYQLILTIRGAFADIFWFSLFHEIGHIINGDIGKSSFFMDINAGQDSDCEYKADKFAADTLLNPNDYCKFIEQGNISYSAIAEFAQSQNVPDYIVIGRMQKEHIIPYSQYANHKIRYKWDA